MKEETRPWMNKAHEDLSAAEALLATDHLAPSMFHAEQAMEKALNTPEEFAELRQRFSLVSEALAEGTDVAA